MEPGREKLLTPLFLRLDPLCLSREIMFLRPSILAPTLDQRAMPLGRPRRYHMDGTAMPQQLEEEP